MEIIQVPQGSDEWFQYRVGSVGASSLNRIITSTGKRSSSRKGYMYQLAGEIISGVKAESYSNQNMQDGVDNESLARKAFEEETGKVVMEVGLCIPDDSPGWHCSPDGLLITEKAGLEVKYPIAATQVKRLDKQVLPTEYKLQCQMSLLVTGYPLWYFCSYREGFEPFIIEVQRDEEFIKVIQKELGLFVKELKDLVDRVQVVF